MTVGTFMVLVWGWLPAVAGRVVDGVGPPAGILAGAGGGGGRQHEQHFERRFDSRER
ncbi:MAG: hypothetical protein OXI48_03955 [bacterium]|nr:hypothetical protein [bacterium]